MRFFNLCFFGVKNGLNVNFSNRSSFNVLIWPLERLNLQWGVESFFGIKETASDQLGIKSNLLISTICKKISHSSGEKMKFLVTICLFSYVLRLQRFMDLTELCLVKTRNNFINHFYYLQAVCMFALLATSNAGNLKAKRGLFGSPEADLNALQHANADFNGGYPSGPINSLPLDAPLQSGPFFNGQQGSINSLPFGAPLQSGPFFNGQQGPIYNAPQPIHNLPAPQTQTFRTIHTNTVERVPQPYPVPVERTVLKAVHVDRPYPQPYTVLKNVPQPFHVPVDRIVLKPVPVSFPFFLISPNI